MRRPDARRSATRYLVMGVLALAGCGRGDVPADAAASRSSSAALESGLDLVVTEVRGPASVWIGQGFTATVKVCNQGSLPSDNWPRLELFLSTDAALTFPDPGTPPGTSMDQVSIGLAQLSQSLLPGQCERLNVNGNADLPPAAQGDGAYYLAAAIDTHHAEQESRKDNNLLVGGLMGVGQRSDLVVTGVSAPGSLRNGQDFTATVTVCNQGTTNNSGGSYYPYGSSRVELFLSMDAELTLPEPGSPSPSIPMDQASIGYVELDKLFPGQCVKKNVGAAPTLPPAAQGDGAYYLIAAVDPTRLEEELREDNNVHVSGLVGVGERPDLVVTEVSGPASVRPWDGFTASVKVCNQGTAPSTGDFPGTQVELFLSADATVPMPAPGQPADLMPIASVYLPDTLFPGQCVTKRVSAPAALPPGGPDGSAYYLAAAVDTAHQKQELREDNNVRVGGLMGIGHRPDLVVTEVSGPTSSRPWQNFMATVKVCNQGTSSTNDYYPRARLELFLSTDTELTLPDPYMPFPGMPMDQQVIGELELDALPPGQCVTRSVYAHAGLPPAAQGDGAYYLMAAIDTNHAEQELREDNNVRVGGLLGVGHRPDLVVTEVRAPASSRPGKDFTASVKVCNQGTTSTGYSYGSARVELFLSMDAELTLPDPSMPSPYMPVDQVSIGHVQLDQFLHPAQCVTKDVLASAFPPPVAQQDGAYYLAAAIDTNHVEQELREDNNVLVGGLLGVGERPDLVVTEVRAPSNLRSGQDFVATAKVCNQGTSPASGSSRLELFLSMDTELTLPEPYTPSPGMPMDQHPLGHVDLDQVLPPGQCVTKNVSAFSHLPPAAQGDGAYYLAAAIDTNHASLELREDNNVHVSGLVGVGERPDLVVTGVSGPASLLYGQGFTAMVKVCNQGTRPTSGYSYGPPRLELFLSMDTELTLPDPSMPAPSMPMDQTSIGEVELDPLGAGQCVTKSVYASAYVPPAAPMDGAYHLIAAVDTNHAEKELREDNNVHVGGLLGVGHRPDLVVTQVKGPTSAWHGQGFMATVEVCNQGTRETNGYYPSARLELFLSMDAELTLPDPYQPYPSMPMDQQSIGYLELGTLRPGQCVTKNVPANAELPPAAQGDGGAYYLAAAVDVDHAEQELREDNNVRVGGLMGVGHRSDLVVTRLSGPDSLRHGQGFMASVEVCNQGTRESSSFSSTPRLELYLSVDADVAMPDPSMPSSGMSMEQVRIGQLDLDQPLRPGQCTTKSVPASADVPPTPQGDGGAYYLAAAVDVNHAEQELREDNNVRVGSLLGVGYRSDLVVTRLSGPASLRHGQGFTASVEVCNQGTRETSSFSSTPRLELYLSVDADVTMPDPFMPSSGMSMEQVRIGQLELDQPLRPGQCTTKSVYASADVPPTPQGEDAYYLAAAIDTNHTEQELREDNNVRVGSLVGVGYRSDLVVTRVSGPASLHPGQSFTASVEVCNQGTRETGLAYSAPRLELYLSVDADVRMPDLYMPSSGMPMDQVRIGQLDLDQPLQPGQCTTKSVYAHADLPPVAQEDGAYYLAAAVDTNNAEQELREDNNVRVGGLMAVGHRPDLVVTRLSGPASLRPGHSFMATVEVCNQGTRDTGLSYSMPRLELYLSMDTTLTLPDPYLPSPGMPTDQVRVGQLDLDQPLQPGQCTTKSVYAHAEVPPAAQLDSAYYLVAAVDTNHAEQELREDNNVRVGDLMGVGHRPDLVVTEVSAPTSARPGDSFTASVKVCNQGTGPSSSGSYHGPRLELFLSTDTELTLPSPDMPSPDMPMDQRSIGYVQLEQSLQPGQCVTQSVPASADLPPAAQPDSAYYLVAAVDTSHQEQELREDNNVHVGGLMGVGYHSDLVVTEVSAPASIGHGQGFTASVKVCNQGTSMSRGSYYGPRLELFLSMDTELTLPSSDMPMDQRSIGHVQLEQFLQPGQCVTQSVPASAELPPAAQPDSAYYVVAAVDTHHQEQELREDNNVHVGGLMGVGYSSDLVVSEVSAPASIGHGQNFTASVKVCNQGTAPSSGSSSGARVELFLSMDTELTLLEPYMPPPPMPMDQRSIGYVQLEQPLQPGRCVTKSVSASADLPPAAQPNSAYYLVAVVDTHHAEEELREDNNVRVGGLMGVGHRPDFVVSEVSAPASARPGDSFTASVKVCNQGTAPSSGSSSGARVELFLSTDTELTLPSPDMPMDMPMDQMPIGYVQLDHSLQPGQCVTKNVLASAYLPPQAQIDRAYYLVAAVDTDHEEQELREDNNVRVGGLMGVGHRSDLVVSELNGPANIEPGQAFTASVKVCNEGTSHSYGSSGYGPRVELFLSVDAELTLPDPSHPSPDMQHEQMPIGYVELDQPLAPRQCVTKSVSASAQPPHGAQFERAFYLAAAVDTTHLEQELREDNNVHVGGLMGVGHQSDLVVSEVSAPASVGPGESFTASVKVCNQGRTFAAGGSYHGPTVELFLSTDTELTLPSPTSPSTGMESDQMPIGYVQLDQDLLPGECVTKSLSASAQLPPEAQVDGAYHLIAAVDTNHFQPEVREDNNVFVGGLLGVGYRPDLVVSEVSAPASVEPGQGFTASVKVCNQGTAPSESMAWLMVILSTDAHLVMPDPDVPLPFGKTVVGALDVAPLPAGQCVTMDVPAYATLPAGSFAPGVFHLGAIIDKGFQVQELREDNNARMKTTLEVTH